MGSSLGARPLDNLPIPLRDPLLGQQVIFHPRIEPVPDDRDWRLLRGEKPEAVHVNVGLGSWNRRHRQSSKPIRDRVYPSIHDSSSSRHDLWSHGRDHLTRD